MSNQKVNYMSLLALTLLTVFVSPGNSGEQTVNNLNQNYVTISVTDAKALTENTTDLFILDVRTQAEYDFGYIDGAVLIPHTEIQDRKNELPTNTSAPILVYCGSGMRSANASQQLEDLGYSQVYNMDNGLMFGWIPAGYWVTVAVEKVRTLIKDTPDLFILDARTQAEFDAGYIDGATLIPHTEIQDRTDELPTNKSEILLVYCGSGKRSANASQQLEELGYVNVRNMANGLMFGWIPTGYWITLSVAKTKALIDTTPDLFILDARTQAEYDVAHIEGATLIPHTEIADRTGELPSNKSEILLVYCGSGKRSANASQQLEDLGYTNVRNMANGLMFGWIPAGYPIINGTATDFTTDTITDTFSAETTSSKDISGFTFHLLVDVITVLLIIRRRKK
ncbi:MAG: rhodanese-like domain-containing protein [Promethearchaeota archaeon]